MPKYVKLFPLQAMTFQKWPSWSCEILNILFKGQFYYYKENIFWEKLHKFILADIILFASGEKFFRASICVWPRERETDHEPSRQEVTAFIISGGCTECTCPLYTLSTCTLSLSPQLVHWPGAGTRTLPGTARHDFSLQSGSNIAKIFSTIKSTQISSS